MGLNSMTGFGRQRNERNGRTIGVDVQSVNSKQLDLNIRMPFVYKPIENDIRQMVSTSVERGKVDVIINVESEVANNNPVLNAQLALHYYKELKSLETQIASSNTDFLGIITRLPDVFKAKNSDPDQQELTDILETVQAALLKFKEFRAAEGKKLEAELQLRVKSISSLLLEVESLEEGRIARIRERLEKNFFEFFSKEITDKNRFEQEMIYYLEKLDITEEKVRLRSHCHYFQEVIIENSPGRKLNFISQEMGREINTLGSKANHAGIQKLVVLMKDELEKIKEQLLNVL
jgi:uncharacterized protein (TIGR00255 family)